MSCAPPFMRATIAALIAVAVAARAPSQPAALDAPPIAPDAPPSTRSIPQAPAPAAQAPMSQQACTQEVAVEIVRKQHTSQASNDPCVVYWRTFEVLAECDRKLRQR
jgi:hypothetical protein